MVFQPGVHLGDFLLLGGDHLPGKLQHLRVGAVSQRDLGHIDGALVVRNHRAHEVLIGVTGRGDGTHLVRLARFGGPIITPGVKAAVGTVTQWLEGQGATVRHRGY